MPFKVQEIMDRGGIDLGEKAISHNLIMCNKALLRNLVNCPTMQANESLAQAESPGRGYLEEVKYTPSGAASAAVNTKLEWIVVKEPGQRALSW